VHAARTSSAVAEDKASVLHTIRTSSIVGWFNH
jgi:hypothetical protein